jgi:hypothetical protein
MQGNDDRRMRCCVFGATAVPSNIDLSDLADELAEIARTTTDAQTGVRLMEVVERLLAEAGLLRGDEGGGDPPSGWSEPECCPA